MIRARTFSLLLAVATDKMVNLVVVQVDQVLDVLAARARLWTRIRYGTTEADIILDDVGACGIFERVLDVRLLHAEVPIDVATVMRCVTFRHVADSP